MYIPNAQSGLAAGIAFRGALKDGKTVSNDKVIDFAIEECVDDDGNQRCSKPFLVSKSTCYNIEWSSSSLLSHTTAEIRDAGSNELVYYRDTNGEYTAEKNELVYLDFKPKFPKTGNATVEYTVKTCT